MLQNIAKCCKILQNAANIMQHFAIVKGNILPSSTAANSYSYIPHKSSQILTNPHTNILKHPSIKTDLTHSSQNPHKSSQILTNGV